MATRRRMDGFSDDGLSYSVAADFEKQIGQAMAEQEARLKDPRFAPGTLVERPDAPEVLQRELIDPVLTGFGLMSPRRATATSSTRMPTPRTYEMGNELVQVDPITGRANVVFTQPKQAPEMTPRERMEYNDLLASRRGIMAKDYKTAEDRATLSELERKIEQFGRGQSGGPVRPGQRGKITPDLVEEYKRRAKGDLEAAKRMAIDDGFDIYVD